MITTFNDKSFELDKNLSQLGLLVFHPIVEQNDVFGQLASPMPPLLGIATNFPYNLIEPSSIKPSSFQLSNFKPSSIETMPIGEMPIDSIILRKYPFVEPLPVCNCLRKSIRSIMEQFQIFNFTVAIWSIFESSKFEALNICEMLSPFCNEMAMVATDYGCLGWIGHMFVTVLTKSSRLAHLEYVAELEYEPEKSLVYHIPSNTFDEKKDGCGF
jgi:hypothetical protein